MLVNMHDAKTRLSELVAAAERGEEVIIARDGTPAVRLVAVGSEHPPVRLGALAGQIDIGEDFDEPLPEFASYIQHVSGVLVDTHIALWALGDPAQLTDAERALLIDPSVDRRLSPMSIWEAAIKREAGRLRAPPNLATVLAAEFQMLDLSASLLETAAELPRHHADPFDRVLIAHALEDDLSVLTRDRTFAAYGVRIAA